MPKLLAGHEIPIDQAYALAKALMESAPFLHESTAPDLIAASQREEVRLYRKRHKRATLAEISDALDLPVWSVECRIAELDGKKRPYRKAKLRLNDAGEQVPNPHAPFFGGKQRMPSRSAAV